MPDMASSRWWFPARRQQVHEPCGHIDKESRISAALHTCSTGARWLRESKSVTLI